MDRATAVQHAPGQKDPHVSSDAMSRLRSWPSNVPTDFRSLLKDSMQHAMHIMGAERAVMVWEESDEPWLHLAALSSGNEMTWVQEPPGRYEPVVAEAARSTSFLFESSPPDSGTGSVLTTLGSIKLEGPAVHVELLERFQITSGAAVPFSGVSASGHLLFPNLPRTLELLAVGDVVANLLSARIDQFTAILTAREDAVTEERIRVARDLHDGLLQSFTGVVLQLETVHQILEQEPELARKRITELQGVIMSDQRELRSYLQQLRPRSLKSEGNYELLGPLTELRERYQRQWDIDVDFEVDVTGVPVSHSLGQEVSRLIAEAVANAAKHGMARNVFVRVSTEPHELQITVHDDGTGFSFRGRHNLAQLRERREGPVSLSERILSLGGDLMIESEETGVCLEMRIPLTWPGLE